MPHYKKPNPKENWKHGFTYSQKFTNGAATEWEDYPKKYDDEVTCFLNMLFFVYRMFSSGTPVSVFYQMYKEPYR